MAGSKIDVRDATGVGKNGANDIFLPEQFLPFSFLPGEQRLSLIARLEAVCILTGSLSIALQYARMNSKFPLSNASYVRRERILESILCPYLGDFLIFFFHRFLFFPRGYVIRLF